MSVVSRNTTKTYFERGDRPTQEQFSNTIDTLYTQSIGFESFDPSADGATDDLSVLNTALSYCRDNDKKLIMQYGKQYLLDGIVDVSGVSIEANNSTWINNTAATDTFIKSFGSVGTYNNLDDDAKKGDSFIKCAALASSVSNGDLVRLKSTAIYNSADPNSDTIAEIHEVQRTSGDYIYFGDHLFLSYKTSDTAQAAKVDYVRTDIRNLKIKRPEGTSNTSGIVMLYNKNSRVDIESLSTHDTFIRVDNSVGCEVNGRSVYNYQDGLGYGVVVAGASHHNGIRGTYLGCRHGYVEIYGTEGGITFNNKVNIKTSTTDYDNHLFDTHWTTGSVIFENCTGLAGAQEDYVDGSTAEFTQEGEWAAGTTYDLNDVVWGSDLKYYQSQSGSNTGNDPTTDDGSNWRLFASSFNPMFGFRSGDIKIQGCKGFGFNYLATVNNPNGSYLENLDISDTEINGDNCQNGILVGNSATIDRLACSNVTINNKLSFAQAQGSSFVRAEGCTIGEWHFENIKLNGLPLYSETGTNTLPSVLKVDGGYCKDTGNTSDRAIDIDATDVSTLILDSFDIEGWRYAMDIAVSMDEVILNGSSIVNTSDHMIVVSAGTIGHFQVVGGRYFKDSRLASKRFIDLDGTITYLTLQGPRVYGSNVTNLVQGSGSVGYYTINADTDVNNLINITVDNYEIVTGTPQFPRVMRGSGSPEGSITAGIGAQWLRSDGGSGTTLYIKESGTGNTGWVAK